MFVFVKKIVSLQNNIFIYFLIYNIMLKTSLSNVLSEQVNAEYYSAYLYLTMSSYADRAGFKGIANWFFVQAQEDIVK